MRAQLLIFLISISLISISSAVSAESIPLDQVPPLSPLRLLVSKTDRNYNVLVAREDGGFGYFLIFNQDGYVHALKLNPEYVSNENGTLDFYLESGERFLIPANSLSQISADTSYLGAAVMYQDKAPLRLADMGLTPKNLKQLNFFRFIAPKNPPELPPTPELLNSIPLENVELKVLIEIRLVDGLDIAVHRKIEENLKALNSKDVFFLSRESITRWPLLRCLASRTSVSLIEAQIPKDAQATLEIFDIARIETQPHQSVLAENIAVLSQMLNDKTLPLQVRAEAIIPLSTHASLFNSLSETEKITLAKGLLYTLQDLGSAYAAVEDLAIRETALADFRAGRTGFKYLMYSVHNRERTKSHPLQPLMLNPIRSLGVKVYELLDLINHPLAREFVIETSNIMNAAGFNLLKGKAAYSNSTYFQEWLNSLRVDLARIDQLPHSSQAEDLEMRNLQLRFSMSTPSENFTLTYFLIDLRDLSKQYYYFRSPELTARLPTFLLGLPGNKDSLKRDFVQYIIEADKKSEKLARWYKKTLSPKRYNDFLERGEEIVETSLYQLIVQLNSPPHGATQNIAGFSETEYQRTVIDILQQLLEVADVSLVNKGTYFAILDASATILKKVEHVYSLRSTKYQRLVRAATRLQRTIHHRTAKNVNMTFQNNFPRSCTVYFITR